MHELYHRIGYLEEQLAGAVRVIQLTTEEPMNPQFSQELRRELYAFLSQNSDLNKPTI
jgi:hypothetical protein